MSQEPILRHELGEYGLPVLRALWSRHREGLLGCYGTLPEYIAQDVVLSCDRDADDIEQLVEGSLAHLCSLGLVEMVLLFQPGKSEFARIFAPAQDRLLELERLLAEPDISARLRPSLLAH